LSADLHILQEAAQSTRSTAYSTSQESDDGMSDPTGPQEIVGTASYMSPEQSLVG
jgi:hypothetical protein